MSSNISTKEARKLHAKSGNRCALCKTPLVDINKINAACIGQDAHIYGEKPGSARYNPDLDMAYVNSEQNLIFLCCNCHTRIDREVDDFPPEKLFEIKAEHEREVLSEFDNIPEKICYTAPENFIPRKVALASELKKGDVYFFLNRLEGSPLLDACLASKKVVLLGEAGTGKSEILKNLAFELSNLETCGLYPILYDLKYYTSESIEEIINQFYPKVKSDRLFLIFDSYDEIQNKNLNDFARKLNKYATSHPNTHILISSRNNFYTYADNDGIGSKFENFSEYSLCPLSSSDIRDYVSEHDIEKTLFDTEINSKQLNDLISIPFYLVEIVSLLESTGSLPNKQELMERIIYNRLERDFSKYSTTEALSDNYFSIDQSLQKIAFAMQCMKTYTISDYDYQKIISLEARKLLRYSGIFNIDSSKNWMFKHNNFREYLSAKYMTTFTIDEIKIFLCNNNGDIKPSWINVLSFLIPLYDWQELFNLMHENKSSLIFKFERERFSEQDRNQIFVSIFEDIAERNIWLSRSKYDEEDLAEFAQSKDTCLFLLSQIEKPQHFRCQSNALRILSCFKNLFGLDDTVRSVLFGCIKSAKTRDYEKKDALEALSLLKLSNNSLTNYLIKGYCIELSSAYRYGAIKYLSKLENNEEYIDVFIKEYDSYAFNDSEYSGSIHLYIQSFFEEIKSFNAICKLLIYFSNKREHYSNDNDLLTSLFDKTLCFYPNKKTELFNIVFSIMENAHKNYNDSFVIYCRNFFKETNSLIEAFIKVADKYTDNDWQTLFLLERLGDDGCYEHLLTIGMDANKYDNLIYRLCSRMQPDSLCFSNYKKVLTGKGFSVTPRSPHKDTQDEWQKGTQEYFDCLFEQDKYANLINELILYSQNSNLTYGDLKGLVDRYEFDNPAKGEQLWLLSTHIKNEDSPGKKVADFLLDIDWDIFSISIIYSLLKGQHGVIASEEQKNHIKKYCDKVFKTTDLSSVVKNTGESGYTYTYPVQFAMFFSAYFDFKYEENIHTQMLYIPKYLYEHGENYSDTSFSKYVTKHLSDIDIKKWIAENAKPGRICDAVAEECLTYCQRNKLICAKDLADSFCNNPACADWTKMKAVQYLEEVFGYEYLYNNYLSSNDEELLKQISQCTLKHHDVRLTQRLEEFNKISGDSTKFLLELITLESKYGLGLYYTISKDKMTIPDYGNDTIVSSLTEAIGTIENSDSLNELSNLQELLFTPNFKDKDVFGLYNSLYKALRNIAQTDHLLIKDYLNNKLNLANITDSEKCFCNSLLEDIEQDYGNMLDEPWSLNSLLRFFKEHSI